MCHYCGCREMPLLRDYMAEHERAVNLGGAAVRALDRGDLGRTGELLAAMGEELASHWRGEENGLFAVLEKDELYAQHIAPLVREHRDLAGLLESADLSDQNDRDRLRQAVNDLHEHIAKEEDGLFPASLTALGGDEWDAAMLAWHQAHPDRELIADVHSHDSAGTETGGVDLRASRDSQPALDGPRASVVSRQAPESHTIRGPEALDNAVCAQRRKLSPPAIDRE